MLEVFQSAGTDQQGHNDEKMSNPDPGVSDDEDVSATVCSARHQDQN